MDEEAARLLAAAQVEGVQTEEFLDLCRRAFTLAPHCVEVFRVAIAGMVAHTQLRNSHELVRQAIALFPNDPKVIEGYATWLEYHGNFDVAVAYWRRLARVAPEADPHQLKLARALLFATDLAGAAHILQGVIQRYAQESPSWLAKAHALYGEVLLKAGDPAGFGHYVYRIWANAGFYEIPGLAWWRGESLAGKRLIITHHLGYGDQLLLASVIPILEACGITVGVTLDNAVAALVAHALPQTHIQVADRSCSPHQGPGPDTLNFTERFKPDFQTTLLHLPQLALGAAGRDCGLFRAYLSAPEAAKAYVAPVMDAIAQVAGGRQIVALAWDCVQRNFAQEQGEYVASFSQRRSIPTAEIAALVDDPAIRANYHFVSLHPHTHFPHIADPLPENLSLLGTTIGYFTDTAAVLERCDSVLSIDMSMANLASLMNKDTTLMLQHEGEWRFGVAGERSPWLGAPRCIRQVIPGEWGSVLRAAREHLLIKAMTRMPVMRGETVSARTLC